MGITLAARRLIAADSIIDWPLITIEDSRIVSVSSRAAAGSTGVTHDFADGTLTAGLLDIHTHGAVGHDVMGATPEALARISRFLAQHGIAGYLATTVTASLDFTLRALDGIARTIEQTPAEGEAAIRGIHLEGPFLSHSKRGMHPPQYLLPPDVTVLNRLWQAARGHIRLMTIAPELPGACELIERAAELGIRSSLGHSNALAAEALAGLKAGAVSATHTFNAMRPLDHREPGILGFVLDRDDLYADLICDGIHVAPEMVRLWFKAKGSERAILITDALEAAGMPDGLYKLGETPVRVNHGRCLTESGVLAGSVITLDQAVANFQQFTGASLPAAVRLASRNPARMLGLPDDVAAGSIANLNVYGADGRLRAAVLRGQLLSDAAAL